MNKLTKYISNPIAARLIEAGKFEAVKFEQVNGTPWVKKYSHLFPMTIKEAFELNTPSLATYRKYKGDEAAGVMVAVMIVELVQSFNVGKKMNETQIRITAQHIIKKYYFLTVADFRLCFNNAIAGEYGVVYDRLDTNVILSWLKIYNDCRLEAAQYIEQQQHESRKKPIITDPDPEGLARIAEMGRKIAEKVKAEKENEPAKVAAPGGDLNYMIALEAKCKEVYFNESHPQHVNALNKLCNDVDKIGFDYTDFYNFYKKEFSKLTAAGIEFGEALKTLLG
jgi:hypothetical protein